MRREKSVWEGRVFFLSFFLSYLTAFSVWNTDEEIKKKASNWA